MSRKKRPGQSGPGPERGRKQSGTEPSKASSDYLLDAAEENWPDILMMYRRFEDKRPVVLFDIQEKRIYAYPYADFSSDLSERSQLTLQDQYERALRTNKIVVFVRDNEQRRLVSFSIDNE
jgi:hypothetical protein